MAIHRGRRRQIIATTLRRVIRWARGVAIVIFPLLLGACTGNEHMSFLDPQGPVAQAQMKHFYLVLGIMAVFVAGPIFLVLPLLLWRYRYGNTASRYTPRWRDNGAIVLMTWGGPILIVCALGYFVWRDSHRLDPYKPLASSQPALQVQVIGYDWKWLFIYPDQRIATIGTFVMPVGRPVTLHLTSATVMQSFFIPALGSQIYAMGGMVTQLNLEARHEGRFLGENTMYNGNGFHFEKFVAVAMPPTAFAAWVREVRTGGMPLNPSILKMLAESNTREQLIKQLPREAAHGTDVYLTGVTASLFPRVVKAMRAGTMPEHPAAGSKGRKGHVPVSAPTSAAGRGESP